MTKIELKTEWEDAPGVAMPCLAATWARIEINANNKPITQFLSLSARTVRSAIHGSAFPLARWIARRWWNLLDEGIPGPTVFSGGRKGTTGQRDWFERHNLVFSREGMSYPDLSIYREDNFVGFRWVSDLDNVPTPGRFVSEGFERFERARVAAALSDFVERVLERIEHIHDEEANELRDDWRAVCLSERDEGERVLCSRLAALGLDPYSADMDESLEERLAKESLPEPLLHDLLASLSPEDLENGIDSVRTLLGQLPEPKLGFQSGLLEKSVEPRPYKAGYARAETLRRRLNIDASQPIQNLDSIFGLALGGFVSRRLDSVETRQVEAVAQSDGYAIAGKRRVQDDRFLLGRILHHCVFVADKTSPRRLLTQGNDWQQSASRAFAAELLAPAAALRKRLPRNVGWDTQDALAEEFGVSPTVIAYQIQNHHIGL